MAETIFARRANAQEHYQRGLELKQDGLVQEAEQEFRHSLEEDPAYFEPLLELLVCQEESEAAEEVRTDSMLKRADQKYKLGMALIKHGRPEKALRHLKAACDIENTNSKYHCGYAEGLLAAGRQDEAEEILRYAAEAHGGSNPRVHRARANMLLGDLHYQAGHRTRARRRLVAAYTMDPNNMEISLLLKKVRIGLLRRLFLIPKLNRARNRKSNA
jgi:thioredoxin-like negative regulator of GroEL